MNKIKLILLSIITITTINATTISGIGYADLGNEAKKEALADLSNKISVNVKSNFKTITKAMGKKYTKSNEKLVQLSSNLPILGASFEELVGNTLVKSTATINSQTALNLYTMELKRLSKNISHGMLELETTKNDDVKYTILNQILNDIKNFNKHKIVATLLEAKNLPTLTTTVSEVSTKLQKYIHSSPSIKIASIVLTKNINQKNIYISAIRANGRTEVTQFAKLLKNEMSTNLNTIKQPSRAKHFLRGEYEILKNKIFITVNLSDNNNNIILTNTAILKPSAYKNTRYKPSTKTFDKALNSEFVKSGKLNVQIGFKGYSRANGIDLNQDNTVDIVVKTNKPMCYFLIGHTLKENDKFSYLLPMGSDNSPFINRLTGEDVNRNITIIDEVPIEAPFGSENLQIFSSTLKKNGSCPLVVPNCSENDDGYCVVSGKPSKVIMKTRGLNIKKRKFKIEQSEDSISFTSFRN